MENALSDEREAKDALSEKNGELLRELSRTKDTILEKELTIENLKTESSNLETEINNLRTENGSINQANDVLKKEYADSQSRHEHEKKEWTSQMEGVETEKEKTITELKSQIESLSSRLQAENVTATSLDEYKKRAQAALKKVNINTLLIIVIIIITTIILVGQCRESRRNLRS